MMEPSLRRMDLIITGFTDRQHAIREGGPHCTTSLPKKGVYVILTIV
jgi:hypothetical protein